MSSPSQLYSCVDSNTILKSPLNTSTAKYNWSFSKDSRFKNKKPDIDIFYNLPDTKSSRYAGIGIGKKTDLEFGKDHNHVVPPSTAYNIKSFSEINETEKKGFTPRYSRQETAPMGFLNLQARKTPGPGRYEEYRYNDSPRWSLKPRGKSQVLLKKSQLFVPGPGAHQNKQVIDPVGKYYLSNHPSSKAKIFNPPRSARFNKSTSDIPGPGSYQPRNDLPADGNYILSKNKSSRKRAFLMGNRTSFVDEIPKRCQTPGPGSYRIPSDFGQYDEKKQLRRVNSSSKRTQRTRADK